MGSSTSKGCIRLALDNKRLVKESHYRLQSEHLSLQFNSLRSRALCVGIDTYSAAEGGRGPSNLPCCHKDVQGYCQRFTKTLEIPNENIVKIISSKDEELATSSGVSGALISQASKVAEEGILIVVFSGHSSVSKGVLSLLMRKHGEHHKNDQLKAEDLISCIFNKGNFHGRYVWLILDCCYASSFVNQIGKMGFGGDKLVVLSACRQDETSWVDPLLNMSVVSYFLHFSLPRMIHRGEKNQKIVALKDLFDEVSSLSSAFVSLFYNI